MRPRTLGEVGPACCWPEREGALWEGGRPHSASRCDLYTVRVFVVVGGGVDVVGDQLLILAVVNGHHRLQEVQKLHRMRLGAEVEIDALRSAPSPLSLEISCTQHDPFTRACPQNKPCPSIPYHGAEPPGSWRRPCYCYNIHTQSNEGTRGSMLSARNMCAATSQNVILRNTPRPDRHRGAWVGATQTCCQAASSHTATLLSHHVSPPRTWEVCSSLC